MAGMHKRQNDTLPFDLEQSLKPGIMLAFFVFTSRLLYLLVLLLQGYKAQSQQLLHELSFYPSSWIVVVYTTYRCLQSLSPTGVNAKSSNADGGA